MDENRASRTAASPVVRNADYRPSDHKRVYRDLRANASIGGCISLHRIDKPVRSIIDGWLLVRRQSKTLRPKFC